MVGISSSDSSIVGNARFNVTLGVLVSLCEGGDSPGAGEVQGASNMPPNNREFYQSDVTFMRALPVT